MKESAEGVCDSAASIPDEVRAVGPGVVHGHRVSGNDLTPGTSRSPLAGWCPVSFSSSLLPVMVAPYGLTLTKFDRWLSPAPLIAFTRYAYWMPAGASGSV